MSDNFKTLTQIPLNGIFDSRSSADQQAIGAFCWKQNWEISPDGKMRNARGFVKPYGIDPFRQNQGGVPCPYVNWDFHNQGFGVARADREPMTLLFPSTSNLGIRRLYMGTKTKFLRLEESVGTWTTIGSGFAADGSANKTQIRFYAAELQDKIILTNGYDKVQYHTLGTNVMQEIGDLNSAGEGGAAISKAEVVVQWQGVIFLMNMMEGSSRFASRIRWSDLNNGISWNIATSNTISDYQDLDYGERILAAIPLLDSLYVFTDRSIWKCNFVVTTGDAPSAVLNCVRKYTEPKNQAKCLAYRNSLVSDGFNLWYMARDAIYKFNPYSAEPERVEFVYRSSDFIFDRGNIRIDVNSPVSPIGEYWPDSQEIHFSWPIYDATFIGDPSCNVPPPVVSSGLNRHTLVVNTKYSTTDYRDYGMTALASFKSDPSQNGNPINQFYFFGSSSIDYCLKQIGVGHAREIFDLDSYYATASQELWNALGYYPILRAVMPTSLFDVEKFAKSFYIDAVSEDNAGNVFRLRTATSYQAMDANNTVNGCGVLWRQWSDKVIRCLYNKSADQYSASNVRPNTGFLWSFLIRGKFLYWELKVSKPDGSAPDSGSVIPSRIEIQAEAT